MPACSPLVLALAATAPAGHVPAYQTWTFAAILALTFILLAAEKVHKTIVALLAGGICLLLGDVWGYFPSLAAHRLPPYIAMIEWEVIGVVIGATVFVEIAARSGVFAWVSIRMLKLSRGDPFRLLVCFSILTAVFSAFLDNITAMIVIGSLTVVACRKLRLDSKPFLLTEGIMTNVGGLLTLISSIPNIIIGKAADIDYIHFVIVAGPYTVFATAATLLVARLSFGEAVRPLSDPAQQRRHLELVLAFDEWEAVKDRRFFWTSIVAVVLVILAFALRTQLPVLKHFGIEVVALAAAVIMMLLHAKDVEEDLDHVEWSLVFFFVGLFTLIGVVERAGVLHAIGALLSRLTDVTGGVGLMWLTAVFSGVTDNIPLAAMLGKIFGPTPEAAAALPATHWWAVVFGANLGGNLTPIGSASTVVAVTIMKKNKLKIGFLEFVRFGLGFTAVQLVLASGYLLLLRAIL